MHDREGVGVGGCATLDAQSFRSVGPFDVGDRIKPVGDLGDSLGLEHAQYIVEILVNPGAFVEWSSHRVADDAPNLGAREVSLDVAHLAVDLVVDALE